MIVTVTANPSLDRTIEVEHLLRGTVHRAGVFREEAGGKGVNVARALASNQRKVRAVLPSGGIDGTLLTTLLVDAGIDFVTVPITEPVRTNISVAEADGTVTKLNTAGPNLQTGEVDALLAAAVETAGAAAWAACSGSLPPGAPDDLYARLVAALRSVGCAVAVDTSGPALAAALAAGPDLVKPNAEELAEAVGAPITTLGEALAAAQLLRRRGAKAVLASLGRDGALLVDGDGALHGEAPVDVVRSAVGAGDATLAGFLAAAATGGRAWLRPWPGVPPRSGCPAPACPHPPTWTAPRSASMTNLIPTDPSTQERAHDPDHRRPHGPRARDPRPRLDRPLDGHRRAGRPAGGRWPSHRPRRLRAGGA